MTCPVCGESSFAPFLAVRGRTAARCQGCGCVALCAEGPPVPANADSRGIEQVMAARYLAALMRRGFRTGSLLVAAGAGQRTMAAALLHRAQASGLNVQLQDLSAPAAYDAAILLHLLQTQTAPGELLERVHTALRPGAPLLIAFPGPGMDWPEDRWRFDETTIQLLLLRHGFRGVLVRRQRPFASGRMVTAMRASPAVRPKCSIIVAAFNERRTFPVLMEALLRKEIPGVDREILVIESHSTDGTRELALGYQAHPEVKVILQDRPRGKGHAVREGLRHATGDIVLIQDADLEYDLNDYDALLAPILGHRALFVLGTRHGGAWKMRRFARQKTLAATLNFGHAFFTGLINVLYRQNMTDPFTMFKVFRRDCLFGLEFQCNRFDFDHELVIKFVRKGYRPLEIPVNYSSRSFREGKKVRLFRDPLTWLWVDLKLRVTRVLSREY